MAPALLVRWVAALSGLTGAVAALLALYYSGRSAAFSVLVGVALGVVNFWAIVRLVEKLMEEEGSNASKARAAILLGGKFIALTALIGVLVVQGHVGGGPFMAGLSMVPLSIVLSVLWYGDGPKTSDSPNSKGSDDAKPRSSDGES